jgi:hypothetical protein
MSAEVIQFKRTPKGINKDALRARIYAAIPNDALGCIVDGKFYEVTFRYDGPQNVRVVYDGTRNGQVRVCRRYVQRNNPCWYLQNADEFVWPINSHRLFQQMQDYRAALAERLAAIERAIADLKRQQLSAVDTD